jgi:hypothetical protein
MRVLTDVELLAELRKGSHSSQQLFGRQSSGRGPVNRHQLLGDSATGFRADGRQSLDHAVPFRHIDDSPMIYRRRSSPSLSQGQACFNAGRLPTSTTPQVYHIGSAQRR